MARLNEPSAAAPAAIAATSENVDLLRRRFIRQNRELAKNNSAQSLKIRGLERDVSRLSAENYELRAEARRSQHERDLAQRRAGGRVRAELREKLEALMGIVENMEEDQSDDVAGQPEGRKPLEGPWRERQPLSELMRDSQMPTILEDKQYPRRSLGTDDVQAIRLSDHSSNESPDLGPPPVARFDYDSTGDPVKVPSPLGNKVMLAPPIPAAGEEEVDDEEMPPSLSVNLETRRKRKDAQPRLEIRRRSLMPSQSPEKNVDQPSTMLRTGAKRKLADREAERPIKPPSKGDFSFSRKLSGEEIQPPRVTGKQKAAEVGAVPADKPTRKVLGDKSVNMSPRKTTAADTSEISEKARPVKPAASRFQSNAKDRERDALPARRRRPSAIPLPSPQDEAESRVLDTVEVHPPAEQMLPDGDLQPKTPAAADLFSPTPSEPSARPEGRSGTPPPGDLSAMSITTDGGTRPSRRARGAVNYAEPSLNAKMRRPGKQMVDAISGIQPHSRAMSSSSAREPGSRSMIKAEPVDDEVTDAEQTWKDLPPAHLSPWSQKSGVAASGSAQQAEAPEKPVVDKPSLVANSRKRRTAAETPASRSNDLQAAIKRMEELDIYEFKDSSSPLSTDDVQGNGGDAGPRASHRRHSSMSAKGLGGVSSKSGSVDHTTVAEESTAPATKGSVRAASRRRSMML